jgi:putative FmdB family regulatory protein
MPIYEYKCGKCGHITEVFEKFSDPPLQTCEVCGGKVKKIISQNTFHLKGTGWYVTDYASKSRESKTAKKDQKETKEHGDNNKGSNKESNKKT